MEAVRHKIVHRVRANFAEESSLTLDELKQRPCGRAISGARSLLHDDLTVVILDIVAAPVSACIPSTTTSTTTGVYLQTTRECTTGSTNTAEISSAVPSPSSAAAEGVGLARLLPLSAAAAARGEARAAESQLPSLSQAQLEALANEVVGKRAAALRMQTPPSPLRVRGSACMPLLISIY